MLFCISSALIYAHSLGAQTGIPASGSLWIRHWRCSKFLTKLITQTDELCTVSQSKKLTRKTKYQYQLGKVDGITPLPLLLTHFVPMFPIIEMVSSILLQLFQNAWLNGIILNKFGTSRPKSVWSCKWHLRCDIWRLFYLIHFGMFDSGTYQTTIRPTVGNLYIWWFVRICWTGKLRVIFSRLS